MTKRGPRHLLYVAGTALFLAFSPILPAAAQGGGAAFLAGLGAHRTLGSTEPANGDLNPYAVAIAPAGFGSVHQGDVLVTNFNNARNFQGTGSTIMAYRPATGAFSVFATVPRTLAGCPGGVGLTAALAVLKSGWVIVGSAPSTDGTPRTLGTGCLIVLDARGNVAGTITGPEIDDPWGDMAVIDRGDQAQLFVSNVGFGLMGSAAGAAQRQANVVRLDLVIAPGKPPAVRARTVIAEGFGAQTDPSVFLIGPTGLALGPQGQLFVSDALGNRIVAIDKAATRTRPAGTGREVTRDGFLHRPLALVLAPNGNLLAVNGLNGDVVEIDPGSGRQIGRQLIDDDEAQTPPGSGDLFGLAIMPDGEGFYYVEDDVNTLVAAKRAKGK